MQNAEVVLSMLAQKSIQKSEYVFDRLYRNLFNPDFYLLAYSTIYAKEGNMIERVDQSTINGFNAHKVEEIIALLKTETYYPRPVRSTAIPKKNDSLRPLHNPSFQDTLVQEVLRLLLQAIYEPLFKDSSHGFRTARSCHTALVQLKTTCKGTNWVIEGAIQGFFDTLNHVKLLELLSRKISDGRFLHLIERFLKAGYMEFWQVHNSLTETPQGGIVGPILANIYLHELDVFMEQTCNRLTAPNYLRRRNAFHQDLDLEHSHARKNGDFERANDIIKQIRTMPSQDSFDPNSVKVNYIRYADSFLVMILGSKNMAEQIREAIKDFLQQELQLELSLEKTAITHLNDQRVRFLGYEIARTRENTVLTEKSLGEKKRVANETIQLLVPGDVIQEKLKPFVSNGKAIHHNARINLPLLDLLTQYNAEIRGLYNYYCLATDVNIKLGKYRYYHYYSLLKTVARKEKCSIARVLSKYGVDVKFKQKTGTRKVFGVTYQTREGLATLTYFNDSIKKKDQPHEGTVAQRIIEEGLLPGPQTSDRVEAQECELCGYTSDDGHIFEVHHIKKLNDMQEHFSKSGEHVPNWVLTMYTLRKKTLVVCKSCHNAIHSAHNGHGIGKVVVERHEN